MAGNLGADEVFQKAQALEGMVKEGVADLEGAIADLDDTLRPLIKALASSLDTTPKAEAGPKKPLDWRELYDQLSDLGKLLDESDLEAGERLAEVCGQLTNPHTTPCALRLRTTSRSLILQRPARPLTDSWIWPNADWGSDRAAKKADALRSISSSRQKFRISPPSDLRHQPAYFTRAERPAAPAGAPRAPFIWGG